MLEVQIKCTNLCVLSEPWIPTNSAFLGPAPRPGTRAALLPASHKRARAARGRSAARGSCHHLCLRVLFSPRESCAQLGAMATHRQARLLAGDPGDSPGRAPVRRAKPGFQEEAAAGSAKPLRALGLGPDFLWPTSTFPEAHQSQKWGLAGCIYPRNRFCLT